MNAFKLIENPSKLTTYDYSKPYDQASWVVDSANGDKVADAISSTVFVLLGATSALGPAAPLLELGATVAAVARPGAKLDALMAEAKGSKGELLVPQMEEEGGRPGIDILKQVCVTVGGVCVGVIASPNP